MRLNKLHLIFLFPVFFVCDSMVSVSYGRLASRLAEFTDRVLVYLAKDGRYVIAMPKWYWNGDVRRTLGSDGWKKKAANEVAVSPGSLWCPVMSSGSSRYDRSPKVFAVRCLRIDKDGSFHSVFDQEGVDLIRLSPTITGIRQ
jgi:hypothetical protein